VMMVSVIRSLLGLCRAFIFAPFLEKLWWRPSHSCG
jgi:hypothetical protein